jgi:type II secretory pathway component PulC
MRRKPRRLAAIATVLAPRLGAEGGAEPVAGEEPGLRLAATLQHGAAGMALVASGEQQVWLRPGDRVGACVLRSVEAAAAVLVCDGRLTRTPLLPGRAEASAGAWRAMQVELPPGMIEALAANPQALALGLDVVAEVDGGVLRGWRIALLEASNPLFPLGLRENDLVLAVAGFPAAEPHSLVTGLRALPQRGSFNITVQREGRIMDLAIIAAAHGAR